MESKGNDALLKTTQVTEWSLSNGGYISLAFGGLLLLGCVVAYVIAVARGNVDAILPLISDAAGSPPQNGVFGTLVCLGGMFGVVFMIQRYMIVLEKNKEKSSLVTAINKLSLVVGILSMLGITLITGYPINFYRNRDVWMMDVGTPHMIGGVMLFSLGLCYIALQCILTLFLKQKNENTFSVRVLLLFICTSAFVYHMITVPEHFGGVSHLYYSNETDINVEDGGTLPYPLTMGASLKIPIDTGGSYVASAIAQWIFVFFFCCFIFTFFREAQEYSLFIVIETHTPQEFEAEDSRPDFRKVSLAQNGGQIMKPAPEVRKILRRDSTCQTMTNTLNDILSSKNDMNGKNGVQTTKTNENSTVLINSEVDKKLTRLLSECESADNEFKKKEINESDTTVAEIGNSSSTNEIRTQTENNAAIFSESNITHDKDIEKTNVNVPRAFKNTEDTCISNETEFKSKDEDTTPNVKLSAVATHDENTKIQDSLALKENVKMTKEEAEKEEEKNVIDQIDAAIKDEEINDNQKTEKVEGQPSNCPMSVQ